MASGIFQQALAAILDNYADVIEGGNAWRGSGTSYRGIPGRQSNDQGIREDADTPLTADSNGTTTTMVVASTYSWDSSRWAKTDTPGFFLLCTSATNAVNVNAARRITGWNNTTKTFTTDAFPAATSDDDVFTVLQGFKRLPNQLDIESAETEAPDGYDRMFSLRAAAGEQLEYFGSGKATYKTELELRLRINKYARQHDAIASAFENASIVRQALCMSGSPDHRDGTYTMALISTGAQVTETKNDARKIVLLDKLALIYRIDLSYN